MTEEASQIAAPRGGRRVGAGRPHSGRKSYCLRLKPSTMAALLRMAKPKSVSEYLDDMYGANP